ncbi:MAG: HD-GYP domain-containing protein, partial [Thermodesulfobacteriota bacterium]
AGAIGLSKEQLHSTGVGALLHDIGKTGVSEQIIRKPGGLSSEEWQKIKEHPQIGSDIISRMDGMDEAVSSIVYEHHIKYDESGYPEEHGELNPLSQIITICDAYDALTTLRVYQKPNNPAEALKIMSNFSGRHFHPGYMKTFTEMIGIYPVGTLVRLSTNDIGVVTKVSGESPSKPLLKIICDAGGNTLDPPVARDLSMDADDDRTIIATVNPASLGIELGEFFKEDAAS